MDVSDVKKLLQAAKGVTTEAKIVDATSKFAARRKIVETAQNKAILGKWTEDLDVSSTMSEEDLAYNDMLTSARDVGMNPKQAAEHWSTATIPPGDARFKKPFHSRDAIEAAVAKAGPKLAEQAPVKVAHPFNPKEVFQFPAGTDEKKAKELVRQIITKRVKEGEEKIDLPSHLPGEDPPISEGGGSKKKGNNDVIDISVTGSVAGELGNAIGNKLKEQEGK